MTLALLNALRTKLTGTTALTTAFPGGFHIVLAADESVTPFLVFRVGMSTVDSRYGGVAIATVEIDFIGVGKPLPTLMGHMETLTATLDDFLPTLSSGRVVNVVRTRDVVPMLSDARDQEAEPLYQASTSYRYTIEP